jgi:GNAT superfamily N-acetyltransferase
MWSCREPAPFIFLAGVSLDEGSAEAEVIGELRELESDRGLVPLAICDSWGRLDLRPLGYQVAERGAWFVRPPGSSPERAIPPELTIEEVDDIAGLREFEAASSEGFEHPRMLAAGSLSVHAPGVLDEPAFHAFTGRFGGRVVSVAMAYVAEDLVGIYGVATLPGYRRRGYGEALTWAAMGAAFHLPAVLQPSAAGASTYRRMGFTSVGGFTAWLRSAGEMP